ncbi:MAG: hypothetical protein F4025_09460 [Synechococcus sp. SB0669_bin_7]|nr:hypothetical protein [Synechococcus sp. SB0675_bin_7]MYK86600.1 hypothetical protein [Synechococcus sp. SB0669_bin_7]
MINVPSAELARSYLTGEDVYLGQGRWWRWRRDGCPRWAGAFSQGDRFAGGVSLSLPRQSPRQ